MQYMLLIMGSYEADATRAADPSAQGPTAEEFLAFEQAMKDAGVLGGGAALYSVEVATTVQVRPDGERVVTHGPFAETREYLGGYDLIDVPDLDAALDWAARSPGAKYGRVEVRPLMVF